VSGGGGSLLYVCIHASTNLLHLVNISVFLGDYILDVTTILHIYRIDIIELH